MQSMIWRQSVFARGGVLELRLAKSLQEAVLIAVGDLLRGEHHVDEVLAKHAGEGLFEKAQVHLLLLLPHEAHEVSTHAMISRLEFT